MLCLPPVFIIGIRSIAHINFWLNWKQQTKKCKQNTSIMINETWLSHTPTAKFNEARLTNIDGTLSFSFPRAIIRRCPVVIDISCPVKVILWRFHSNPAFHPVTWVTRLSRIYKRAIISYHVTAWREECKYASQGWENKDHRVGGDSIGFRLILNRCVIH